MTEGRGRFGLFAKVAALLLVVAAVPLVVSGLLVGEIARVAQNVAEGETQKLLAPLERAEDTYRRAVEIEKGAFSEGARAAAAEPALRKLCLAGAAAEQTAWGQALDQVVQRQPGLAEAVAFDEGGRELGAAARKRDGEEVREMVVEPTLAEAPCRLRLTYHAPAALVRELREVGAVLAEERARGGIKVTLPNTVRVGFLTAIAGIMGLTVVLSLAVARRTTRRIARMVAATRAVARGDLQARVRLGGRDELSDLADAFDHMLDELARSRAEIEYLEKIGAWQEVARRLAHEIKNPLTPIQLSVQELHRKYDGADPRYRKLLDQAHEIVTEEIAGMRRLVDAFHDFAKLPRVEAAPLDFGQVVKDAEREVELETDAPSGEVVVAADRLLMKRVLCNLVENARQAGAQRVRIAWRTVGDEVRVEIDDDGPGVPAQLRPRVFDPYVTTKESGTGLGLAIAKKTVLEHGGSLELSPEPSPLGGARFELRLPLS